MNTNELSAKLNDYVIELAQATDAARATEQVTEYMNACAKFHNYSFQNILSILINKPDATHVAGYHRWLEMGRFVKKGEKGIPILAPLIVKKKEEEGEGKKLIGFKVVYVFDYQQTDGKSLPEQPDWKSPEKNDVLSMRVMRYAENIGILVSVSVEDLPYSAQGMSSGGKIILDPTAGTKTLIHELAHELIHKGVDRLQDGALMELEAESIAYIVSRHFGLTDLKSPNYIALCGADSKLITEHLKKITATAAHIITGLGDANGQMAS